MPETCTVRINSELVKIIEEIIKSQKIYGSVGKFLETGAVKMIIENNLAEIGRIVKHGL